MGGVWHPTHLAVTLHASLGPLMKIVFNISCISCGKTCCAVLLRCKRHAVSAGGRMALYGKRGQKREAWEAEALPASEDAAK